MAWCFPFLLLLLLLVTLWSQGLAQDWGKIVPKNVQSCCERDSISGIRCPMEVAFLAPKGQFYAFRHHLFVTVNEFRPNGMPVIGSDSSRKVADHWHPFKFNPSIDSLKYGFVFDGKIYFQYEDSFYVFSAPGVLQKTTKDCEAIHPLACVNKNEHATVAVFKRPAGEPFFVTYHRRPYDKIYDINAYIGKTSSHLPTEVKVAGQPKAITVFRMDPDTHEEEVIEFNQSAFACFYRRKLSETNFRFANPEPTNHMVECWQSSLFFGCPQSFCYRNDVDAIYRGPATNPVTILRGNYVWRVTSKPLPLDMPQVRLSMVLGLTQGFKEYPTHVDAGELLVDSNKKEHLLLFKDQTVTILKEGAKKEHRLSSLFPGLGQNFVDAVWFNGAEQKMYIFKGQFFWVFAPKETNGDITWSEDGSVRRIGNYMRGLPGNIDGVVSMEGEAYVMRQQWYYKLNEKTWNNEAGGNAYKPTLIFGETFKGLNAFFNSVKFCVFTEGQYNEVRRRLGDHKPKPAPGGKGPITPGPGKPGTGPGPEPNPGDSSAKPTGGSGGGGKDGGNWWWLIILLIILALIVAGVALFFFMSGRKKQQKDTPKSASPSTASKSVATRSATSMSGASPSAASSAAGPSSASMYTVPTSDYKGQGPSKSSFSGLDTRGSDLGSKRSGMTKGSNLASTGGSDMGSKRSALPSQVIGSQKSKATK